MPFNKTSFSYPFLTYCFKKLRPQENATLQEDIKPVILNPCQREGLVTRSTKRCGWTVTSSAAFPLHSEVLTRQPSPGDRQPCSQVRTSRSICVAKHWCHCMLGPALAGGLGFKEDETSPLHKDLTVYQWKWWLWCCCNNYYLFSHYCINSSQTSLNHYALKGLCITQNKVSLILTSQRRPHKSLCHLTDSFQTDVCVLPKFIYWSPNPTMGWYSEVGPQGSDEV